MLPRTLLLFLLLLFYPLTHLRSAQPNIVLFVSDDMGWNDVGYHGSGVETPNIDQLVKDGVELDRFYAYPICSPTRAALMTGRTPIRFGILSPIGGTQGLPGKEETLPEILKGEGYQTFLVGKWHLGSSKDEFLPRSQGFDHHYGFLAGFVDYYTHGNQRGDLDWQRNGKTVEEEGYSTDLLANEAVKLLKGRDKSKPVFLFLAFNAPHSPFKASEELVAKYSGREGFDRNSARAACIDAMDTAMGKVLAGIEKEGMTDDTLVLFFCDNGASGGRGRRLAQVPTDAPSPMGNGKLSGGKGSVQEGGIRVPAVMKWPGVLKAGTKSDQFMSVLDLLPTLTAAAGIHHQSDKTLDGSNVWPALTGNKTMDRKPLIFGAPQTLALIDRPWKLIKGRSGLGLYDVVEDPSEEKELSADHPEIVADLLIALEPFEKIMEENPAPERQRRGRRARGGLPPIENNNR